jgi:protein-S-isoprenylcysteine O-methyltransferase Ste14
MFVLKVLFALLGNLVIFGGLLFLPAGTLTWGRAWVFLGTVSVCVIATMMSAFQDNEELWNERLKLPIQADQPLADKIIIILFLLAFCGLIIFIPLDVFRFHLFNKTSGIISALGLLLFIAGWWIIALSFKENTFAAPVVKHQTDRHQTVIDTGVYGIVRHPMYAGAVLLMIGMPLWFESYAADLLAILPIVVLMVRILFEEQFLRQELNGYNAYTERVRFKLLPYVW